MKLDLREILAGVISELPVSVSLDMSGEDTVGMLPDNVVFRGPLTAEGVVTDNAGYTRLSLDVRGEYTFECDRCLTESVGVLEYEFDRTVVREGVLENLTEDEADDYIVAHDGFIDIDDILVEETVVSLPAKLICSDDCLGLCSRCGRNLNHGKCDCPEKELDPRLAPLAALLEKMKNEENGEN